MIAVATLAAAVGGCAAPATVRVPRLDTRPVIDGVLDDAYTAHARPLAFRFLVGGPDTPTGATTAWVVSTTDELILFFECRQPAGDRPAARVDKRDGPVWQDDSIEIFLDPAGLRREDSGDHLILSARGVSYDARLDPGGEKTAWNPDLDVKTTVGRDAWTLEMALPFTSLGLEPGRVPRFWTANFCRTAYLIEGREDTAWRPTGTERGHVPATFGRLDLAVGASGRTGAGP
jgi:hypothetical protein